MPKGSEIRRLFLKFFEDRGHRVIPSSSLIPHGDPTLLLTTAGMVQLKPFFMEQEEPPARRLASVQKCFRTTDIESVGDPSHLTFFEMLGNFSIGDYFKKEAIELAWELVTRDFGVDISRLWTTVYLDDDEAFGLWRDMIGVPENRIIRLGETDNFWGPAGDSGPCGPCSEIHYDFGEEAGCGEPECGPACECGRFCEIWNLVFIQFYQDKDGHRTLLPHPSIDTGMGLERITTVLQGKSSVYQTDIFSPLLDRAAQLFGKSYGDDESDDRSLRVVTEHGRAIPFLIADGVLPSNVGRGYVLRRLLRRAALFGRRLGRRTFLVDLAEATIEHMSSVYPELNARSRFVLDVIESEEKRFDETLSAGINILDEIIASKDSRVRNVIPGDKAFKLYDTYGFPIELTREVASSRGLGVDMEGFEKEMERQRERALASHRFVIGKTETIEAGFPATVFTGYSELARETAVTGILTDSISAERVGQGEQAGIVLETTPFYAEMGGQVGDTGKISGAGSVFIVTNTIKLDAATSLHQGYVASGSFSGGDRVIAEVDLERRADITRNHTATHLLQFALRRVLGEHVQQRGSLVAPDRLRFDFSHLSPLTAEQLKQVQNIVNHEIRANHPVYDAQMPYRDALASGAIALFDEKYGETVRVLSVGRPPISVELCGGTHVGLTGEIGLFQILSETSIGAGLRRIEAATGRSAAMVAGEGYNTLFTLSRILETNPENLVEGARKLLDSRDEQASRIVALEKELALKGVPSLLQQAKVIDDIKLLAARVENVPPANLPDLVDALRSELGSAIIVLGTVSEGKPFFVASVTPDLVKQGHSAGNIVRKVAQATGGGGGGKPGMAQGGGTDATKLERALERVPELISHKKA